MANKTIKIKNREGKSIPFRIKSVNAVTGAKTNKDVSGASSFRFVAKGNTSDSSYKINKTTSDFDTSQATAGLISVNIPASETTVALLPPKKYEAELKIVFTSDTDEDISERFNLIVEDSLYHD